MRVLLSTHSAATRTSFGIVCREIFSRIRAADPTIDFWGNRKRVRVSELQTVFGGGSGKQGGDR